MATYDGIISLLLITLMAGKKNLNYNKAVMIDRGRNASALNRLRIAHLSWNRVKERSTAIFCTESSISFSKTTFFVRIVFQNFLFPVEIVMCVQFFKHVFPFCVELFSNFFYPNFEITSFFLSLSHPISIKLALQILIFDQISLWLIVVRIYAFFSRISQYYEMYTIKLAPHVS